MYRIASLYTYSNIYKKMKNKAEETALKRHFNKQVVCNKKSCRTNFYTSTTIQKRKVDQRTGQHCNKDIDAAEHHKSAYHCAECHNAACTQVNTLDNQNQRHCKCADCDRRCLPGNIHNIRKGKETGDAASEYNQCNDNHRICNVFWFNFTVLHLLISRLKTSASGVLSFFLKQGPDGETHPGLILSSYTYQDSVRSY